MGDEPDLLDDTFKLDDPRSDILRPSTRTSTHSCMLLRTMSHSSIDTVLPQKKKGVRRRIEEMAEGLKHKSAKQRQKKLSTQQTTNASNGSKTSPRSKAAKHGRNDASPLPSSSQRSEEESALAITDRLRSGPSFEPDPPLTYSLIDEPLFKEEDDVWEDVSPPIRTLSPAAHVTEECQDTAPPSTPKAGISDIQFDIRASETDVTIWDGLEASHHVYNCRLFLQCTTHPYDAVSLLDVGRVEMECNTRPAGSTYARPPALQASYEGAASNLVVIPGCLPKVNPAAGIHMDRVWCKTKNDDGTWGWYRDAFVPLSPRLFDKMEYREFKLVSRVWVGESFMEGELTFGISMLLRGVDMK